MTGNTLAVQQFDLFVQGNYHRFFEYGKKIYQEEETFQDSVQDNLIKTRDRIVKSGFTGSNHLGYVWLAINNDFKLQQKRRYKPVRRFVDADDCTSEIEKYLLDEDHDRQIYFDQLEVVTRYLYLYIETYYNEQQSLLFKRYYQTDQNTYNKLVANSKYTLATVKRMLSTMKNDLRTNLINYIKFELTKEVFRPVKHYEHLYEVSNKGRIKNIATGVILKNNKNNYELWKDGIRKYKSLEQLTINVFKAEDIISFKRIIK